MRIAAVLFLKTSIRSSLNFHAGELLRGTCDESNNDKDGVFTFAGSLIYWKQ
jgi:hypothetical protein